MDSESSSGIYKHYAVLFVIILLQLAFLIHFMNIRTVVNADETWAFGFANSYQYPFFYENGAKPSLQNDFYNKWHDGSVWFNYITVQPNETFAFDKVYINQSLDCHPPFHFYLIHFICSFFPNSFSLWFGYIINIAAFIITQFFIYRLSLLLLKKKNYALTIVIFFGFSMAGINNYIYIRNYSLLTMFTIIFNYLCILIIRDNCLTTKNSICLFLISFLSFLTHHYFAFYFFSLSVGIVLIFLKKREKFIIKYISVSLLAFVCYYAYFPYVFKHIIYMSKEMTSKGILSLFPFKEILTALSFIINYTVGIEQEKLIFLFRKISPFYGYISPYIYPSLVLFILFVIFFFITKKENQNLINVIILEFITVIILVSCYTTLDVGVYFGRYYFALMPLFCIIVFGFIEWLLRKINITLKLKDYVIYTIILIFILASHKNSAMEYCFTNRPSRDEMSELFRGASIISVQNIGSECTIHTKSQEYMFAKRVFPTRVYETKEIEKAVDNITEIDKNYIIVPENELGLLVINMLKKKGVKPRYLFSDNHPIYNQIVLEIYPPKEQKKK